MSRWPEVLLGDVIDLFDSKRIPLSSRERAERQGAYPYYGAQGVIDHVDGYLFEGRYILIPEDGENLNSRKLPIAYSAEGRFWVNNHAHVARARAGVAIDRFVQGALEATDISPFITGAAQPKLSQANLRLVPLRLPPLEDQRRIAAVLDAIDDLIESSSLRIALLEQIATAIYREWFVYFRYPGHQDEKLIDSPLGRIPLGWRCERLEQVASITMGQSPASEHYNKEGVGLPFHQGVSHFGANYPRHVQFCRIDGRRAMADDHLVSVRAPVGRLNRADVDITIGRGLAALSSRINAQAFLGLQLQEIFSEEDSMGGGTIYKAITKDDLASILVVQPPADTVAMAESVFANIGSLVKALTFSSRSLEALRALLLPKLVTGAVDVSTLDLDGLLEEAAV